MAHWTQKDSATGIQSAGQRDRGRKLVGIISHVTELKEKIDKQIVVEKDRTGRAKARLVV